MPGTLSANSSRVSAGGHASNANRRETALSLSLSLSVPLLLAARRVTRGMGGRTGRSRWSFSFRAPWCVYSSAELVPPCRSPPPLPTGTRTITQFPLWFDSIFEIVRFPTRCSRLLVWSFLPAKGVGIFSLSLDGIIRE